VVFDDCNSTKIPIKSGGFAIADEGSFLKLGCNAKEGGATELLQNRITVEQTVFKTRPFGGRVLN
jgi:hypothetical protein